MSRDFILDLSLLSRSDLSNNISTAKRAPWCWAYKSERECLFQAWMLGHCCLLVRCSPL
jgi:hypothetical protein